MCMICGGDQKSVFWPLMIIGVGVLFLLNNLGLLPPDAWQYWPVILVIIGLVGLSEITVGVKKKK